MSNLEYRLARHTDASTLVRLRDAAAHWMRANGIAQWKPGEMREDHFHRRMADGEVWLAESGGRAVGGWELWWEDEAAWGPQAPEAGYVHRLMVDRAAAPRGVGRAMLGEAERRIAEAGRAYCRLDCVSTNPRLRAYYEGAGYTVVGEQPFKDGGSGSTYGVTLLEKKL
jgi:protein-tyrosine phosphatase